MRTALVSFSPLHMMNGLVSKSSMGSGWINVTQIVCLFILLTSSTHRTPLGFLDDPESLCDALKKYRITCRKLIIGEYDWTSEDCLALLHTLKPIEIYLASEGSTQFEALFHSKTLVRRYFFSSDSNLEESRGVCGPRICRSCRPLFAVNI